MENASKEVQEMFQKELKLRVQHAKEDNERAYHQRIEALKNTYQKEMKHLKN
jgi:hypothetical protein